MNILFIGQVVPEEKINECTAYSVAGDMMQKNIIRELQLKENVKITVASVLPNASFPKDKVWIASGNDKFIDADLYNLSYINIPGIKQMNQKHALYKFVYSKRNIKKYDCIICYNMYPQFGGAALKLAKKLNIPIVAILADLPVESADTYRGIYKFLFGFLKRVTMGNIRHMKHGIILNQNVQKYMADDSDCLIIPGGVNLDETSRFSYKEVEEKKIIYAGALSKYSGITNLIDAVISLNIEDVFLEIYGDGDLKADITNVSEQNKKIKYMGVRPITEMRKIMEDAWVLVNPRVIDDPVSDVTFPSKIFEYIMCKRPVITTEFSGIPEYIKEITFGCGKGTPKEIENTIYRVNQLDKEELKCFVFKSYKYVIDHMSWNKHADKILGYLDIVIRGKKNEN